MGHKIKDKVLQLLESNSLEDAEKVILNNGMNDNHSRELLRQLADKHVEKNEWERGLAQYQYLIKSGYKGLDWNPLYRKAVIYSKGIEKGNNCLLNVCRYQVAEKTAGITCSTIIPNERKYLFVSGMPRSGTTAFGDLLNISNSINLFVEYGNEFMPASPKDFASEVMDLLVSWSGQASNHVLKENVGSSKWVGDKRPYFFMNLPQVLENFKERKLRVFHILRNIYDVCFSYQNRADNSQDEMWSSTKGFEQCIYEINLMLDYFSSLSEEDLGSISFVSYESLFSDPKTVHRLYRLLDVELSPEEIQKVDRFISESEDRVRKKKSVPIDFKAKIDNLLDVDKLRYFESMIGFSLT